MEENTLYHHGIKGMRWGIRRYQNPDGTLTAKGKKRYSAEMEKLKKEETILKNKQRTQAKVDRLIKKRQEIDDLKKKVSGKTDEVSKKTKTLVSNKPKSIKEMTDEELIAKINRLRLEKTLSELTPKETSKGEKFVNKVLMPAGEKAVNSAVDGLKEAIKKKFGVDVKEIDAEYNKLKRDADIAGFKQRIATSESIQRKNKHEAEAEEKQKNDVKAEVKIDATTTLNSPESKKYSSEGSKFIAKLYDHMDDPYYD